MRHARLLAAADELRPKSWRCRSGANDRRGFDCRERALNDLLHFNARKTHERGGAKTFVCDRKIVHDYYSLSPASIEYAHVPEIVRRGWDATMSEPTD